MIDIGANLLNSQFRDDLDAVLTRAWGAGLTHMLVTGTDLAHSAAAIDLCAAQDHLSCTVGVHPHQAGKVHGGGSGWIGELRSLAHNEAVCAIGETGLDFHRDFSPHPAQMAVFEAQIALAAELSMPLFVHDRDSDGAVHELLVGQAERLPGVVIHCFTGNERDLRRYLDAGFHLGLTGWICDRRRGEELRRLAPKIPLDRLLVETDAPFLLPRGASSPTMHKRRNEPCLLPFIINYIAELHGLAPELIRAKTTANAKRLFQIE